MNYVEESCHSCVMQKELVKFTEFMCVLNLGGYHTHLTFSRGLRLLQEDYKITLVYSKITFKGEEQFKARYKRKPRFMTTMKLDSCPNEMENSTHTALFTHSNILRMHTYTRKSEKNLTTIN